MSESQHWKLLNNEQDSQIFESVESEIIENLQQLFGFELCGNVVNVNFQDYSVGFDLEAKKHENSGYKGPLSNQEIFPKYDTRNKLSYWCGATKIKNTDSGVDLETFSDFSFEHNFRFTSYITPIIMHRFRQNGVYVEELKNTQPVTMKKIVTSEGYIEKMSDTMDLTDKLVDLD